MVNGRHVQIVGVAADVGLLKAGELRPPMVYTAFWQDTSATEMRLAVRVVGDPAAALPMLERTARTVDATVPVTEVLPLRQQMDAMFSSVLLARSAISYASMLAVVLCALGLFGALAFAVTIRTREIAVRVALGARHADVVRVVYREAFPVVAVGIVSGLAASWASTRLLASFIYGAGTYSVLPFAVAVALLVGISIVAAAIPIRRAVRIEPRTAMQV
jgi:ABC-type antimicrobial peptide transport system permease subunit